MNKKIPFFVLIILFLSFLNVSSNEDGITIVSNKLNVDMNKRKSTDNWKGRSKWAKVPPKTLSKLPI